ncbi:hypothetical protein DNTS_026785 [Danionella cerebrum]|uniref:Uncharacterized protein n=1 Tax=Danionella cerebrum TaxID=2873325 RepID=A0A553MKN5_9TELE|nr:hypothetical protein DNTS_026785 [Danionella translucida]
MVKLMSFSGDELSSAAATGNTGRVQTLLSSGASANGINKFGRTAIQTGALSPGLVIRPQVMMMGNTTLARLLLDHGADPNVVDPCCGSSPLHDASRGGFLETVRLLVRFHADPNARDYRNLRAVDVALQHGHGDVAEFLSRL